MQVRFRVDGMSCAACSARVEKVTAQVPGVRSVEVNLLAGFMVVDVENESVVGPVTDAVGKAGYAANVEGNASHKRDKNGIIEITLWIGSAPSDVQGTIGSCRLRPRSQR